MEDGMKLLIAVDMEGISGVVSWGQVTPDSEEWQRFRRIMTDEVNAAISGAMDAGVNEVVVSDGHWRGDNIVLENLDKRAKLNSGSPSPFSMIQGVDQAVDLAFFIGYHAMAGTQYAILDHTWSSTSIANVRLNGMAVGETGLNAALCGHFNIPVVLLTGDQSVSAEAQALIPGIKTVIVKKASGRFSAECIPPQLSHAMIKDAAKQAVQSFINGSSARPLKMAAPIQVEIDLMATQMADTAALIPGIERVGGRRLQFTCETMPEMQHIFRAIIHLAG
jgi:D-amino peptidase